MYLQSLDFTVSLIGNPKFWRAGFMLGNEKFLAHESVKPEKAITIHTGSHSDKESNLLAVWKYYNGYSNNNPDSSTVKSEDTKNIAFSVNINSKNFMTVKVQDDVVFAQGIDSSFRRRLYLKAWADDKPNYKVRFKDIEYTLYS